MEYYRAYCHLLQLANLNFSLINFSLFLPFFSLIYCRKPPFDLLNMPLLSSKFISIQFIEKHCYLFILSVL